MTSDISVTTTAYQVERRGWLWGLEGVQPGQNPSVTLDISMFTAATHYPNGYVPSGIALAKITASGLWGPYDAAATDGRQTPTATTAGLLFSSVQALQSNGTARGRVGGAIVAAFASVDPNRLPFQTGSGAALAAFKSALPLIYWN